MNVKKKPTPPMPRSALQIRSTRSAEQDQAVSFCAPELSARHVRSSMRNGWFLSAWQRDDLVGVVGIDTDLGTISCIKVAKARRRQGLGRRLLAAAERHAARYQLFRLEVGSAPATRTFFRACGYDSNEDDQDRLSRRFRARQTRYGRRILSLGQHLGIPVGYARHHRLPAFPEATKLASLGNDVFGRQQQATPATRRAWHLMKKAAEKGGVRIQIVSAFRSVDAQAAIVERKQKAGQKLEQILTVSAAPGYSEHHTGRALDLTTPGSPVLEESFEKTPAFDWLSENAHLFGFRLSFPRENPFGIAFEPWHWYLDR